MHLNALIRNDIRSTKNSKQTNIQSHKNPVSGYMLQQIKIQVTVLLVTTYCPVLSGYNMDTRKIIQSLQNNFYPTSISL